MGVSFSGGFLSRHIVAMYFMQNAYTHSLPGTKSTGLEKCVGFDIPLVMSQGLGILVGPVITPNKMVHISSYFSGAQLEEIKIYTTGCSAKSAPTLILNNVFISGPIIKPFNSMKVEIIRICLVYKTSCQVQYFSIYDHNQFWQKIARFP